MRADATDFGVIRQHEALASHGDQLARAAHPEVPSHLAGSGTKEAGKRQLRERDHLRMLVEAFLALAYAGLNEKEKALEQAQSALKAYEDDAESRVVVETFLAQIQARFGDADSAIAALPQLLESRSGIRCRVEEC